MRSVAGLVEAPAIAHSVPADISFDNYRYFIEKLSKVLVL